MVREWGSGRLFIMATPGETEWDELESSELANVEEHPATGITEAGGNRAGSH